MNRISEQGVAAGAILGWLGVGIYGVWEIADEQAGDGWQRPYLLFSISLSLAAVLTLSVAWVSTRGTEHTALRRWGLGIGVIAVASTAVAWALPLWMTLLALCFIVLAVAAQHHERTVLGALGAAQLIGIAVIIAAEAAEVGRRDSYGDYPAAFGLGLVVTAVLSMVGLTSFARAMPATGIGSVLSSRIAREGAS